MRASLKIATLLGLAVTAVLAGPTASASAHPLGNFTVNAYGGITVGPGWVRVRYVLDLAEIPTFQELPRIDGNGDGLVQDLEGSAWASRKAEEIAGGLSLEVAGRAVPLVLQQSDVELLPGQAGLDVLRLEASYRAAVPATGRAEFHDTNDQGRIGWREVSAVGTEGVAVTRSNVPSASISYALRAYPQDLLSSPLDVRAATFSFGPGLQKQTVRVGGGPRSGRPGSTDGALTALVARPRLSLPIVAFALLVAFGVGALHALAPGHGKTLTAAYLVGSRSGVRAAIGAGVAVSVMHSLSVAAIGILVLFAQRAFPAERVYPWLGLIAGLTAIGLGGGLLVSRMRSRALGLNHQHAHPPLSRRGLAAVALSGGLLPSPSALVVLVAAVTLGRVAFGLGLIAAFSLGLACAIAGIGLLAVRARDLVARRSWSWPARALPIASAAAILLVGVVLTGRAVTRL
jgi:nickel/cobalt transporter (NicO) family protein